jgi:hypothetical protein
MCTTIDHQRLREDWELFERATEPGGIQQCAGFVFEIRRCRRCNSSLSHPRDLARYGIRLSSRSVAD